MVELNTTQLYTVSQAATLAGMHTQTLRQYDRLGLLAPLRTSSGARRYTAEHVDVLKEIQRLSQEEGVNLAGIKVIFSLKADNESILREQKKLRERIRRLNTALAEDKHLREQYLLGIGSDEQHNTMYIASATGDIVQKQAVIVPLNPEVRIQQMFESYKSSEIKSA